MKILILACGSQGRFLYKDYGIKQLLKINGETLIDRMIRQCKPYSKPCVVSWREELVRPDADYFTPVNCLYVVDTLLDCEAMYEEQTVVLLGDVYYTDDCFRQIMEYKGQTAFFTDLNDIFAISFNKDFDLNFYVKKTYHDFLETEPKQPYIRFMHLWKSMGAGWGMLHLICDQTQDFDVESEYEDFLAGISKNRLYNLINKK